MLTINMQNPTQRTRFAVAQARGQCRIFKAGMTIRGLSRTELLGRIAGWTGQPLRTVKQLDLAIADCTQYLETQKGE